LVSRAQSTPPSGLKYVSPERLLVGDAIILSRILSEVRHHVVARVFGVGRQDSTLVTLVVIGAFARALHASPVRRQTGEQSPIQSDRRGRRDDRDRRD
jgi:hypothetical protein